MEDTNVNNKRCEISQIYLNEYSFEKSQKALKTSGRFCCGYLLGRIKKEQIRVYDIIELDLTLFQNVDYSSFLPDNIQAELASIRALFPVGIDIVGVFITQPENGNLEVAEHLLTILKQLEDIAYATCFAICLLKPSCSSWFVCNEEGEKVEINDVSISNDNELSKQPMFRLKQDVMVNWLTNTGVDGLQSEIDKVDAEFIGHKPAFLLEPLGCMLYEDDEGYAIPETSCTQFISDMKSRLGVKTWPEEKPASNVIDVKVLTRISSEGKCLYEVSSESILDDDTPEEDGMCNVPILWSKKVSTDSCVMKLTIDALVTASSDTPTSKLLYMFRDAVYRQQNALRLLIKVNQNRKLYNAYHFKTPGAVYPITVFIPEVDFSSQEIVEDSYTDYRKALHQRFLLPDDRPLLKKCLSYFSTRSSDVYHLVNPHIGLSTPDLEGGKVALVYGNYSYHHYMQDNFDDNIWGCAYRSLQTLSSWFWHQAYTERKYPSHLEIQEALVAMGDKEKNFIGSKEWIGSMEVGYCLDYFFGITSKTLHVSTGAELAHKGRDLYNHFIEQGTPIMIGGGVLAHSIVGVVFNEHTGDIRFLIVDPHFTGMDNLKTVQSKGYVGWKGPDFWDQNAHYNMCMPQRPNML